MAGIEDLENHPAAQIHVPGISSATNKVKKSFNFESGGLLPQQEMSSIDNQSTGAAQPETSAASRTKKQELMNQILQNHQIAAGQFMSNPPAGMKYVSTATNANAPHALTATNSVR